MDDRTFQERLQSFYKTELWKREQYPYLIKQLLSQSGLQRTFTPTELCSEIVNKLSEYINLPGSQIVVLFNLEFVDTLVRVYKVDPSNITYFADSEYEARAARKWYKVECPNELIAWDADKKRIIMPNIKKKFDVVVMNPPYQAPQNDKVHKLGGQATLWDKFVSLALELCEEDGYLSAVHPANWRRPEHEMYPFLAQKNLRYLSIHSDADGKKTFGAGTRYDWYILRNQPACDKCDISDEKGVKHKLDIRKWPFLPNFEYDTIFNILAEDDDEKCPLIFDTFYHSQKDYVVDKKSEKHKYPCVYSMNKNGVECLYSSKNLGHFGVSKVVVSKGRYPYAFMDYKGEFAMTETAFAISIDSRSEGENIVKAINSQAFGEVIKAIRCNTFNIEYRMFRHFRRNFWKEFV